VNTAACLRSLRHIARSRPEKLVVQPEKWREGLERTLADRKARANNRQLAEGGSCGGHTISFGTDAPGRRRSNLQISERRQRNIGNPGLPFIRELFLRHSVAIRPLAYLFSHRCFIREIGLLWCGFESQVQCIRKKVGCSVPARLKSSFGACESIRCTISGVLDAPRPAAAAFSATR